MHQNMKDCTSTLLQTDRFQATALYDSLLHNRCTYCGVSIQIRDYLRGYTAESLLRLKNKSKFDVHESVHRDIITNTISEMQLYRLIYYS
jgi:hypothetical protein